MDQLQTDLDLWLNYYNGQRTHTGKYCNGRTPMQTFQEDLDKAKEKMLSQLSDRFSKLPEAGEAEASNGGDQLARNSQSDRNENGANQAQFLQNILGSNP